MVDAGWAGVGNPHASMVIVARYLGKSHFKPFMRRFSRILQLNHSDKSANEQNGGYQPQTWPMLVGSHIGSFPHNALLSGN